MVASIQHVSHNVLGPEGDEHTPWSRLPPAHQHKPPHPRANTKSTQPLATHHCRQMHSAQSTGIVGSAHCINRERMTKSQPTCRKGYLELQPMEMTLISLIPSTWVLFCQLICTWWNATEKSWYTIILPFTFSTNQSPKVTNGWSWFRKSLLMHP